MTTEHRAAATADVLSDPAAEVVAAEVIAAEVIAEPGPIAAPDAEPAPVADPEFPVRPGDTPADPVPDLLADADLVVHGNNVDYLAQLPDESFRLIYIDPPFNTGRTQKRRAITTVRTEGGSRVGFKGRSYETVKGLVLGYNDTFAEYWEFLEPRLEEAWRLLADDGTLYLHLDYREVHYAKVLLDALFGRECFLNEIIWAYDYGGRSKRRWPAKHDNILVYVKNPDAYYFDSAEVDREPYMAPGLVTAEKVARGKLPTDTWWHTIVSPSGREKTGYPTQKPLGILRRIIQASSAPGDRVLDFFAGSGTTGAAARELGRHFLLVDENPEAIAVMEKRFAPVPDRRPVHFETVPDATV